MCPCTPAYGSACVRLVNAQANTRSLWPAIHVLEDEKKARDLPLGTAKILEQPGQVPEVQDPALNDCCATLISSHKMVHECTLTLICVAF